MTRLGIEPRSPGLLANTLPTRPNFTLDTYHILLSIKQVGIKSHFLKYLVWRELGLNPGLPDHWRTLYPLNQTRILILSILKESSWKSVIFIEILQEKINLLISRKWDVHFLVRVKTPTCANIFIGGEFNDYWWLRPVAASFEWYCLHVWSHRYWKQLAYLVCINLRWHLFSFPIGSTLTRFLFRENPPLTLAINSSVFTALLQLVFNLKLTIEICSTYSVSTCRGLSAFYGESVFAVYKRVKFDWPFCYIGLRNWKPFLPTDFCFLSVKNCVKFIGRSFFTYKVSVKNDGIIYV